MHKIVSNVVVALKSNVFMLVSIKLLNAKWSMRFQRFQEHHKHTKAQYIYLLHTRNAGYLNAKDVVFFSLSPQLVHNHW